MYASVDRRLRQILLILECSRLGVEALLASHRIVDRIQAGLIRYRLNNRLHTVLQLLTVEAARRRERRAPILSLLTIDVHIMELLSSGLDVHELLLELLLALSKVHVGHHHVIVCLLIQLGCIVLVHVPGWRCENLIR